MMLFRGQLSLLHPQSPEGAMVRRTGMRCCAMRPPGVRLDQCAADSHNIIANTAPRTASRTVSSPERTFLVPARQIQHNSVIRTGRVAITNY